MHRRLPIIFSKRPRLNARFARDLAYLDAPARLARALVTLVESEGWVWTGEGHAFDAQPIEITKSAFVAHVGATRESANKWLVYSERRGYLCRQRDSIAVLRLDDLRARADGT